MARIRIIKKEKKPSFAEKLEAQARAIVNKGERNPRRDEIASALERELALTVSHIDHARAVHEQARRSLLRQECYLDTEIMQRKPKVPVYFDPCLRKRDIMRDRLRDVEKERRRLALQEDETMRGLRDRLLEVMNRQHSLSKSFLVE